MTRTMFDAVNPNNIPLTGAQLVAGYLNGDYANAAQLKARFPHITNVLGDVDGSAPQANFRDWEPGNNTDTNLQEWVLKHNSITGKKDAVIYSDRANLPSVRYLTGNQILGTDYWIWQANLDGTVTAVYPQGTVAVQVKDTRGLYDTSLVTADWWMVTPVTEPHGTQTGWAWCSKCQSLFWASGISDSHCAAGSTHEYQKNTYKYSLGFDGVMP